MPAKIVHWEIIGPDGDAVKQFYASLFGWDFQTMDEFPDYHMVSGEECGLGGAVGKGSEEMPQYVTIYLEVEDITAQLEKIEAAGGKTVMPRTVIPDTVTLGMFSDPAGNVVGLVEAAHPEAE
jgi:hypothetical protein